MAIVAEDVFPSDVMDLDPGKPGNRFRVIATSFKLRVHDISKQLRRNLAHEEESFADSLELCTIDVSSIPGRKFHSMSDAESAPCSVTSAL